MNRYLIALGLLLGLFMGREVAGKEPPRPNILYFYVDDMGWGSIGPNGQAARRTNNQAFVQTPNLDRLAARGVNFTRGYGCHVCSPARSSQQSGFHQGHTYVDRKDPNNAKKAMRADDVLIGDALSAAGYVTGYWGKWGYGGSKDRNSPVIENVQTLPTSHGYQHVLAELHHVRAHTFFQPTLWRAPAARDAVGGLELVPNSLARVQNNKAYPATPAFQNHSDYPATAYCDDTYAFAALDFVREQGQNYNASGQPFFGLLAVQIPHAPFGEIVSLPNWYRAYANAPQFASLANQTRQWAAMVTRIDAHFGNILAALDDPNNDGDNSDSIADNTLVVFQSDNGGPGGRNNIELDANGGLSGTKGKIQEGGIRVPLVMRWPATIKTGTKLKAGANCEMVVDVTDLLPTFCELAGAPTPLGGDGVSIAPTLLGKGNQRRREFIIHEAGNGQSIVRGNHKLVRSRRTGLSLYDLAADRAEKHNIAAEHPKLVKELETLLLGERVAEPKGFANTYHRWTGKDGAKTSSRDNWSDYKYSNASVIYLEDNGPPRLSWIASIVNSKGRPNVAIADRDLEVLGLEVRGNAKKHVGQVLRLGPGVNLTGRNEIRLGSHSTLAIDRGQINTLRWIDILPNAKLSGRGDIRGDVYNQGEVSIQGEDQARLEVNGRFDQTAGAVLKLVLNRNENAPLDIDGEARLAGQLDVVTREGFKPVSGKSYTIVRANRVVGRFAGPRDMLVANDGSRFTIRYSSTAVTLVAE